MRLAIVIPALDEAANLTHLLPDLARDCPGAEVVVVPTRHLDAGVRVLAHL